jgi:hypothetical protein
LSIGGLFGINRERPKLVYNSQSPFPPPLKGVLSFNGGVPGLQKGYIDRDFEAVIGSPPDILRRNQPWKLFDRPD